MENKIALILHAGDPHKRQMNVDNASQLNNMIITVAQSEQASWSPTFVISEQFTTQIGMLTKGHVDLSLFHSLIKGHTY